MRFDSMTCFALIRPRTCSEKSQRTQEALEEGWCSFVLFRLHEKVHDLFAHRQRLELAVQTVVQVPHNRASTTVERRSTFTCNNILQVILQTSMVQTRFHRLKVGPADLKRHWICHHNSMPFRQSSIPLGVQVASHSIFGACKTIFCIERQKRWMVLNVPNHRQGFTRETSRGENPTGPKGKAVLSFSFRKPQLPGIFACRLLHPSFTELHVFEH